MDLKKLIDELLGVLTDVVILIQNEGFKWRWLKKQIRTRLWKPYIKPALDDLDTSWTQDALLLLMLVRILADRFWKAPKSMRESAISPETMFKNLQG